MEPRRASVRQPSSDMLCNLEVRLTMQPTYSSILLEYLGRPGPHKLELGAAANGKPGWLSTDLHVSGDLPGQTVITLDATTDFPIPSCSFDYIYIEHMIEHITFDGAQTMLEECFRVLKPSGVLRIVTPSLGFLLKIISPDRTALEDRYRNWSVQGFVPDAPAVTNAFFLNNFVRAWGHTFIYDAETLRLALNLANFPTTQMPAINESEHEVFQNLEHVHRLPPGFLDLESMIMEAIRPPDFTTDTSTADLVSQGKKATQSSLSPWSLGTTVDEDATRVVSGILTGSYNCHTAEEDCPWWSVDLGERHMVTRIRIMNRTSTRHIMKRTSQFEIQISDDALNWSTIYRKSSTAVIRGLPHSAFSWVADKGTYGRYIRIQLLRRGFLHLEQVEVFGTVAEETETVAKPVLPASAALSPAPASKKK